MPGYENAQLCLVVVITRLGDLPMVRDGQLLDMVSKSPAKTKHLLSCDTHKTSKTIKEPRNPFEAWNKKKTSVKGHEIQWTEK